MIKFRSDVTSYYALELDWHLSLYGPGTSVYKLPPDCNYQRNVERDNEIAGSEQWAFIGRVGEKYRGLPGARLICEKLEKHDILR